MNKINSSKPTIKDISKRCNISEQTFYNWKKDKPELIKLIEMGLELEKLIENYQKLK